MVNDESPKKPEELLAATNLSDALESDRFRQFLDQIPFAVVVAELQPEERIVYANIEFERLSGKSIADIEGETWAVLPGQAASPDDTRAMSAAVVTDEDYIGVFTIAQNDSEIRVDAWSNVIEDDNGVPTFRLVALAEIVQRDVAHPEMEQRLENKDVLLRELQHRVKNNLQMITALIRLEARNLPETETGERFDRLAGRVQALGLLYDTLSTEMRAEAIDIGIYLSQVASAVMRAHAVEGIRLDLKIDTWLVSINVAMPAGLVVNELLTNSLKHAFAGRDGGTIMLHCLVDESGCHLTVADDGVGLAKGMDWPQPGKLGALIVKSLRQNAKARFTFQSVPGKGVRAEIFFARENALPEAD